ncbi:hypothetical protein PGTUg99_006849 [Puccinia graminis f. sp. tritici]|uniref:Uncharacterized protein n=1 Tax=Puccinia graminis f. sp. tritici TaxID=56615 RepID=A0A5B0RE80_PUCGR|nr:hypothetical protein PGTUg99_006849 [Puccinia graminis f. sp. tritici]
MNRNNTITKGNHHHHPHSHQASSSLDQQQPSYRHPQASYHQPLNHHHLPPDCLLSPPPDHHHLHHHPVRPSEQAQSVQIETGSRIETDDSLIGRQPVHSQFEPDHHPSPQAVRYSTRTQHAHSDLLSNQTPQATPKTSKTTTTATTTTTTTTTAATSSSSSPSSPSSPVSSLQSIIIQPNSSSNSSSSSLLPPFDPPVSSVPHSNLTKTTTTIPNPPLSPPQYSPATSPASFASSSPRSPLYPPSYLLTLFRPSIRRRSPTVHLTSTASAKRPFSPMDCPTYSQPQPLSASSDHQPSSCNQTLSEKPLPAVKTSLRSFLVHPSSQPQPGSPNPASSPPKRRSWVDYLLVLLVLVIIGTVVVLSTVNFYVGIYPSDVILPSELEVEPLRPSRVPKIIHQTWKTDQIPDRWIPVRESCVAAHESWEYMLWTDKSGRELIEREYPWFLSIYDGYRYPIQRADAVRYFILHHYGGVYMDLDIGCIRPMDSLLRFDLILPQTVPVGVSNDLMFSAKGHPFMDFIIHRLGQFDHDYKLNYATVMFSTGPMALSALLNMFRRSPSFSLAPGMPAFGPVRILPPKLYGKNLAAPQPSPGPYFTHYYGSSWHTDGAGPVLWLGKFGIFWLYGGIVVVLFCAARAAVRHWRSKSTASESQLASTWSAASSPIKSRGSAGTLWKRRLMKVRRAEGRLADVLLLPSHLLEKATTHSSKLPSRSLRAHHQKDCMQCKSCTINQGLLDSSHQLPLYEPRPLHCLASGRRPQRKSPRNDSGPEDEDWEEIDEDTALLSSTSTSDFLSNPTPVLLPSTPTFYRNPNLPSTGFPSLRVEANEEVAPGLPSPLLNAIYRLAEMAGIVSENGQRSDLTSNFPARPEDNPFIRKVD